MMLFYRRVIDPNILISYCISGKLHELPELIEKYNLEFCAIKLLLEEFSIFIERDRIRKYLLNETNYYTEIISKFLSLHQTKPKYMGSPDANDDYLIDLVQQVHAVGLITGDKTLLKWKHPPVQIVSWKNFQRTYPV